MLTIYKLDDNVYYVHDTPFVTYSNYTVKINDVELKPKSSYSKVESVKKYIKATRNYITLDGVEISKEQLQKLESEYFTNVYNDDIEDFVKEYNYKGAKEDYEKFKNRLKSEQEVTESVEDVEYEILEQPKIPEKYIRHLTPCQLDNIKTFSLVMVSTIQFARDTFKNLCEKNGFTFDIPNHSCLRYAKIKTEYIFDESFDFSDSTYPSTVVKAIENLERIEEKINDKVRTYILKTTPLLQKNVGDVIKLLEKVSFDVSRLDVKTKAIDERNWITKHIQTFLTDFKNFYKE